MCCEVIFQISPYGHVTSDVDAEFLRLNPYSPVINGEELRWMQIGLVPLFIPNVSRNVQFSIVFRLFGWDLPSCGIYMIFMICINTLTSAGLWQRLFASGVFLRSVPMLE